MLPRSTRPPVASFILYQASGVSAQATSCFLSLACSRAISLSHSISISLSLADGQRWTGALMGSDGEARCNCVPLHAVVCSCVICAHTPAQRSRNSGVWLVETAKQQIFSRIKPTIQGRPALAAADEDRRHRREANGDNSAP